MLHVPSYIPYTEYYCWAQAHLNFTDKSVNIMFRLLSVSSQSTFSGVFLHCRVQCVVSYCWILESLQWCFSVRILIFCLPEWTKLNTFSQILQSCFKYSKVKKSSQQCKDDADKYLLKRQGYIPCWTMALHSLCRTESLLDLSLSKISV